MTDFTYHVATDNDLAALTDIYNAAIIRGGSTADTQPVSIYQRKQWLDSFIDPYAVFIIDAIKQSKKTPIGFCAIGPFYNRPGYDGTCTLAYYVDAQWQGQGVGTYTLQILLQECDGRGMRKACTTIFADNQSSTALMQKYGFTQYGLLPQVAYDSKGILHDVSYWFLDI